MHISNRPERIRQSCRPMGKGKLSLPRYMDDVYIFWKVLIVQYITPVVIPNKPVHFFMRAMESTFPTALSISLVVNVILGVIFSGMYIFLYPGMTSTEENPEVQEARLTSRLPTNNEFCVSCDYLGESLFTSNTLYTEVVKVNCGNEHRLCCYNDTVLQRFIFAAVDLFPLQNKYLSWYYRMNMYSY